MNEKEMNIENIEKEYEIEIMLAQGYTWDSWENI